MMVISAYTFWYFGNCIIESAAGQTRAPDVLVDAPSLEDIGFRFVRILLCIVFFIAPPVIYYGYTRQADIILYVLLAYTAFFSPIGLLSVVLHDRIAALNPILLIRSVLKTFFSYMKLVILFYIAGCLFFFVSRISLRFLLNIVINAASIYLFIILGHILGRYYWQNQEKLDWDI